jgi:arylsulfatase
MAEKTTNPNVLWYCTDQQRYDTINCLGNSSINTPNLNNLVSRGVAFERAYCQAPVCTPSRATLLTGRYPASHHVHRNGTDRFPAEEVLVTRLFAENRYRCGLVGKLHLSRAEGRVETRPDDGYSTFHWSHDPYPLWPEGHGYAQWLRNERGLDHGELYRDIQKNHLGEGVDTENHQTTWCTEMAIRFIQTHSDSGPWLLCVNPFDPHPPFDPPHEYLLRYDPAKLALPLFREEDVQRQLAYGKIDQQTTRAMNLHEAVGSFISAEKDLNDSHPDSRSEPPALYDPLLGKACYYGMIELIDYQFGRIIEALKRTGQLEHTIVVFTSDHGELLGDHGLLYKGCRFFEGSVHVPLIVSWPEQFRKGLRSAALVELVDLAPTLLDACDIPIPYFMQGVSLREILTGRANPDYHKPHVLSEYNDALDLPNASHGTMYYDGRYKSILYHGQNLGELYDLEKDPGEFNNLWNSPEARDVLSTICRRHFDAYAHSSWPGIRRTGAY